VSLASSLALRVGSVVPVPLEVVNAPPFDAVEIPVAEIFGDDEAGEKVEPG
jgi:hypothetical protein